MIYRRVTDLSALVERRSVLLLGPRQTGKTTTLQHTFPRARTYNLLEAKTFRELSARPELLRLRLEPRDELIVVDG